MERNASRCAASKHHVILVQIGHKIKNFQIWETCLGVENSTFKRDWEFQCAKISSAKLYTFPWNKQNYMQIEGSVWNE